MTAKTKSQLSVEIVTATPALIAELRAMDTHNRRKKMTHVRYLRNEIREGRWTITNQGVGVSESGFLVDGGHRLLAIELEGCPPVQFVLVRGLPDGAQVYVDQHAKRSMADTLTLFFNSSISNRIIAALNVVLKVQNGWDYGRFSPELLIETFMDMESSIKELFLVPQAERLSAPIFAALLIPHRLSGSQKIIEFASQMINGQMLQSGDPALTLRNWLASTPSWGGGTEGQKERFLKTSYALSAFMENRKIVRVVALELK